MTNETITQNSTVEIRSGSLDAIAGQDHAGVVFFARNSVGIGNFLLSRSSKAARKRDSGL
jgi:hypothetical protein